MFTKSQLVATAVLVASASSVAASPIYADVTEIEARSYNRDALTELKRRAVLEYLEELEARTPTVGVTTGAVASAVHAHTHGKNTQQVSGAVHHEKHTQSTEGSRHTQNTHTHSHANGETHKQHRLGAGSRPSHSPAKNNDKTGGERATGHRLPVGHKSSEKHGQTLAKQSSTHRHNHEGAAAGSSASTSVKSSHVRGQSASVSSKKVVKRSVLDYLGDLVGRAPTASTPASGTTKGSPQPVPAKKGTHSSTSTGVHKETEAHTHNKPANVVAGHKEVHKEAGVHNSAHTSTHNSAGTHKGTEGSTHRASVHTSTHNSAGTHKGAEGSTHRPSVHHQSQEHGKGSKHTQKLPHGHESHGAVKHQRVHSSTQKDSTKGHKESGVHEHHRVSSAKTHNTPVAHERVKTAGTGHSSSTNAVSSGEGPNVHNHPAKQQSLKKREIEELAELIARELDLFDDLD